MSLKYRDYQGNEVPISGLNGTSGELVPSVSAVRSGTYIPSSSVQAQEDLSFSITFSEPMPDNDYQVIFGSSSNGSSSGTIQCAVRSRTTTGFSGVVRNVGLDTISVASGTFTWFAFKLMTNESRALDEAKIEQNTKNFAPNFSATSSYAVGDYVTYNNVLYRCTVQHTASAWNSSHFTQVTVGGILGNLDKYSYLTCSQSWINEWTEFGTNWTPFYSFTAPYSGKYRLHSSLIYNINNTSAINVNLRYYNTSIPTTIHLGQIASYGNSRYGINMDCIVELNANDVVQLQFQSEDTQTIRWIQRDNNRGDYWQYLG